MSGPSRPRLEREVAMTGEHPKSAREVLCELHRRRLTGEGTMATAALEHHMAILGLSEYEESVAQQVPVAAGMDEARLRRDEVLARAAVAQAQRCPECVEGRTYALRYPDGVNKTVCAACDYGWRKP